MEVSRKRETEEDTEGLVRDEIDAVSRAVMDFTAVSRSPVATLSPASTASRVSQSSLSLSLSSSVRSRIELRKVSKGNSKFTRILEEYRGKLRPILVADSPPASR